MSESMSSKHKWSIGTGKLEGAVIDENEEIICDPTGGWTDYEALEHANLLVSAPAMYDMIQMLVDAIKSVNAVQMNAVRIHQNLIDQAEALLKKARGEA